MTLTAKHGGGTRAMDGIAMAESTSTPPLTEIVEAFEELGKILQSHSHNSQRKQHQTLRLDTFSQASTLVSILFSCLGLAFKFAEMEYVSKVKDLVEASRTYDTLESLIDYDVAKGTVKSPGSHSRNLRRVRQGLDLIRALFEQFLSTDDYSLREAASTAYAKVCAPYHSWAIRTAVAAGMYALPSRDQLLVNLEETLSREEDEKVHPSVASGDRVHRQAIPF
ncbi:ACD11 homolog protein-like isoform X1 [Malus domestica]|uniref:ACD11 homolog protein-like isoform X1 n=1 Tax=Malus domestica TaxID=3750 RepID=UPI0010A9F088|nr:ACD11 homolog protein-like isoform X2 [Malus domestica]